MQKLAKLESLAIARMGRMFGLGLACVVGASTWAGDPLPGDLLVSAFFSDNLVAFDEWSGELIGEYTGAGSDLDGTLGVVLGPDSLLYVASEESNMVLRYDPVTRAFVDRFVWDDPTTPNEDETGGLAGPSSVVFDAAGNLFVGSFDNDSIYKYDGITGAFDRIFVTEASGGLDGPDAGMTVGPDGHLYVPGYYSNSITYYDGSTGESLGDFVPKGSNGMSRPRHLIFREGFLYAACEGSHNVMRFDGASGEYIDDFVTPRSSGLSSPSGMGWGPDGHFYICSGNQNNVRRYDGETGEYIDLFVPNGAGGLSSATFVYFVPTNELLVSQPFPGIAGRSNIVRIANATPSKKVALVYGFKVGETAIPNCPGLVVDMKGARLAAMQKADSDGRVDFDASVPMVLRGKDILLQVIEPHSCRKSGLRSFTFLQ